MRATEGYRKVNASNARNTKNPNRYATLEMTIRSHSNSFSSQTNSSGNLHRRRPSYCHSSQAVDIRCRVLPRQRRKCDPGHPLWNRALNHTFSVHSGRLIVDHVRLVHPANIQRLAQRLLAHSRGIKGESYRSAASGRPAGHFCLQGGDDRERRCDAGTFDDEWSRQVEGVGAGDAGVEGGGVGYVTDGVSPEEGVVTGFDREDGGWTLDYFRVGNSEARNHVDDGAYADGGDYVGQSEKFVRVAHGERVLARRKRGGVVRSEYILGRLHMDELLGLHARDDVNGMVVLMVRVPRCEILQPLEEEGRLHVFEEVDA